MTPDMGYAKQQIDRLAEQFNQQALLKTEWTHHAHLLMGIWHVHQYDFNDAACRIKSGIILLNNAHHTENTGSSGYHETLTIFWMHVISTYAVLHKKFSLGELANGFLSSPLAERTLPFEFYTKEKIMSSLYRASYIEPDIQPVNEETIRHQLSKTPNTV